MLLLLRLFHAEEAGDLIVYFDEDDKPLFKRF
jgi:hypothetical protein